MKKQLVHVSMLQAAKIAAVLYFVVSLPVMLMIWLPSLFGEGQSVPLFMVVLMPVLYTFFGFLFTLIGAWIYNLVAARIGGFEFTTVEVGAK